MIVDLNHIPKQLKQIIVQFLAVTSRGGVDSVMRLLAVQRTTTVYCTYITILNYYNSLQLNGVHVCCAVLRLWVQIPTQAFLYGVCMGYLCLYDRYSSLVLNSQKYAYMFIEDTFLLGWDFFPLPKTLPVTGRWPVKRVLGLALKTHLEFCKPQLICDPKVW